MKINLKIILPIFLVLLVILAAFGYLLFYLSSISSEIADEASKFQRLNILSQKLEREEQEISQNLLVYIFNQSPNAQFAISQSDLNKASAIDEIYPYIDTEEGKALVDKYLEASKEITKTRNEVTKAIDSRNRTMLNEKYNLWNTQNQTLRTSLNNLDAYNISTFEKILQSFKAIGERLVQTILFLFTLVILSIIIFFYYLRNSLTIPIVDLSKYADNLSNKNFATIENKNIHRSDEIGILFRAFTNMSEKIRVTYTSLEESVRSRTIELTQRTSELEKAQKATLNILEDLNVERKALMETKALDEAILASIGDGMVVLDIGGEIIYVNDEFEKITGWKRQEVINKKLYDIMPAQNEKGEPIEPRNRFFMRILSGRTEKPNMEHQMYYFRKDGTRFAVSSIAKRITLEGKLIGAVKTFRDVTTEREIDRAKTEFVSLSAHQLRTPLSAVSWYTEMLLAGDAGELTETQQKYLNQIYRGNQRMINMVKTFLDASRIDLGTLTADNKPTDIIRLLESVVSEQKPQIEAKKLQVIYPKDLDIPQISADPRQIRMVFQNLLSNAIKYTPDEGKIEISVAYDGNKKELYMKFSDSGFGIPAEDKKKIFTKLFRAQNVVEKDTEGTGLGLYIVKNIVTNAGGNIWFDSTENVGTDFYLTLPV